MKAVVVDESRLPSYASFNDPEPQTNHEIVSVRAAALTNLDIAVAEGRHYLSLGQLSAVVGGEAVVATDDGSRFFLNVNAIPVPYGSMTVARRS